MIKFNPIRRRPDSGQTLIMFVFFLVVLMLFIGLGIDIGFAYVSKAELSKAVDAAALAGMKSLSQGTSTASNVAAATFAANYGRPGRDVGSVTPGIGWSGETQLTVTASTTINTFFIRVLPIWKTLSVSANAQTKRTPLILTLVLDDSGSMNRPPPSGSGGAVYLPGAVTTFVNTFDEAIDKAAMVSFSTIQKNEVYGGSPIQPTTPFKSPIITAVNNFTYPGSTFSQGGLTNALVLENNATIPIGQTPIKVVVFFTDGLANTFQVSMHCPATATYNVGGNDSPGCISIFDPATGSTVGTRDGETACSGSVFCPLTTNFVSAIDGSKKSFTQQPDVQLEALYRAVQVANDMRAAGIYVYAIGCGSADLTFLQQVANDPSLSGQVPTSYDGEAVLASNASELNALFQTIAAKILTRLTQ